VNRRSIVLGPDPTPVRGWIDRRWCAEVYETGLAFHGGALVLARYATPHLAAEGIDFILVGRRPDGGTGARPAFREQRLGVARGPDGSLGTVSVLP
jgi:hypothetical protein